MAAKPEWQIIAEGIIKQHNGKAYFNLGEARKIIGCGENTTARLFHDAGIVVKKIGRSKRVSAYDIASMMMNERIAAVE
jgi:hypothetical protein